MAFKKAERKAVPLRIALVGPSGSGKTKTALRLARGLVGPDGRIAVIDTEKGSSQSYADEDVPEGRLTFDIDDLRDPQPEAYIAALEEAGRLGYDAVVVDSLSHAWQAVLERVDQAAARSKSKNSYVVWSKFTPLQNRLVGAILNCPCHVIATMRTKTAYEQQQYTDANGRTKNSVQRVGLAPIQRDGLEYEFTVVADMEIEHNRMIVSKSRCPALQGQIFDRPGGDVAAILLDWQATGKSAEEVLADTLSELGIKREDFDAWCASLKEPRTLDTDPKMWAAVQFLRNAGGQRVLAWVAKQAVGEQEQPAKDEPESEADPESATREPTAADVKFADYPGGQGAFFAAIAKHGVKDRDGVCTYSELADWHEAHGRPRPSRLPAGVLKDLIRGLEREGLAHQVAEWAAKRAADAEGAAA